MTIYFARHGEDLPGYRGGWSQWGLTELGRQQAENLAQFVSDRQDQLQIQKLLASDLPRALETAEPVAKALNLLVDPAPQFREFDNGRIAGPPNDEVERDYPGLYASSLAWDEHFPDGESPHEFFNRISKAWKILLKETENNTQTILLITHGGVLSIIQSVLLNEDWNTQRIKHFDNAGLLKVLANRELEIVD